LDVRRNRKSTSKEKMAVPIEPSVPCRGRYEKKGKSEEKMRATECGRALEQMGFEELNYLKVEKKSLHDSRHLLKQFI